MSKGRLEKIMSTLIHSGYSGVTPEQGMRLVDYLDKSGAVIPKYQLGSKLYVPNMEYQNGDKDLWFWETLEVTVDYYEVHKEGEVAFIVYKLLIRENEDGDQVYRTAFDSSTNVFTDKSECDRYCDWMNTYKGK